MVLETSFSKPTPRENYQSAPTLSSVRKKQQIRFSTWSPWHSNKEHWFDHWFVRSRDPLHVINSIKEQWFVHGWFLVNTSVIRYWKSDGIHSPSNARFSDVFFIKQTVLTVFPKWIATSTCCMNYCSLIEVFLKRDATLMSEKLTSLSMFIRFVWMSKILCLVLSVFFKFSLRYRPKKHQNIPE